MPTLPKLRVSLFDLLTLPADLGFDNGPRILHRLREPGGKWFR